MSKSIAQKIVKISKEIGQVKPTGRNDYDRYDFIGYEQLNAVLRTLLEKHNLALIPSFDRVEESSFTTSGGKASVRSVVYGKMIIICGDTGDTMEFNLIGADQDLKGKSTGQAITEAVKRFELKLFHVSTKADIDPDSKSIEHMASNYKPTTQKTPIKQQPINDNRSMMAWLDTNPDAKKFCKDKGIGQKKAAAIFLKTGPNKNSFIDEAEKVLDEELAKKAEGLFK